jgi:DNA-binding CsgD family transcriptional regulator
VTKPREPEDLVVSINEAGDYAVLSFTIPEGLSVLLTAAERDVALLVLAGKSHEEIARIRGRAVRTIANQLASVFRKLGVASRTELLVKYGEQILML